MRLGRFFTLAELDRHGEADATAVAALTRLAVDVLDPIRERWGPMRVTSGYRSPERNARTVGASPTSQHTRGEAADVVPTQADLRDVWAWVASSSLPFGQVILEERQRADGTVSRWLHVSSATPSLRAQVLRRTLEGRYVRVR